jgi:O-antigen ligase
VEHLTNAYGAYGTMLEPNIFGGFAAACLVLAVVLLVAARHGVPVRDRRIVRWLAIMSAAGLVLSFTRAAWLGAIAGLVLFAATSRATLGIRLRPTRVVALTALGVLAIVALTLLAPGDAGTLLRFKLANLVNLTSSTGLQRLVTYGMAIEQTAAHPFVGWGTYTFAPLVAEGTDFQQFDNWRNLWLGNWLLLALHDTGMIGAALWIGLLTTIIGRGLRTARRTRPDDAAFAAQALALTLAFATLLVPFLTTTGFSLGYPWMLSGLLAAQARVGPGRPARPATHAHPSDTPEIRAAPDDPPPRSLAASDAT